jgi:hypothetical protein
MHQVGPHWRSWTRSGTCADEYGCTHTYPRMAGPGRACPTWCLNGRYMPTCARAGPRLHGHTQPSHSTHSRSIHWDPFTAPHSLGSIHWAPFTGLHSLGPTAGLTLTDVPGAVTVVIAPAVDAAGGPLDGPEGAAPAAGGAAPAVGGRAPPAAPAAAAAGPAAPVEGQAAPPVPDAKGTLQACRLRVRTRRRGRGTPAVAPVGCLRDSVEVITRKAWCGVAQEKPACGGSTRLAAASLLSENSCPTVTMPASNSTHKPWSNPRPKPRDPYAAW